MKYLTPDDIVNYQKQTNVHTSSGANMAMEDLFQMARVAQMSRTQLLSSLKNPETLVLRHLTHEDIIKETNTRNRSRTQTGRSLDPGPAARVQCPTCQGSDLVSAVHELICKACGWVYDARIENSYTMSNGRPDRMMQSDAGYKRINHFNEKLNQLQGKEVANINSNVITSVNYQIDALNLQRCKLTPLDIRGILKKLRMPSYYEHINYLAHVVAGYQLPSLTPDEESRLRGMFVAIQKPFEKYCPPGRKNFLNYSFVLRKFLEILEWDTLLPYFPLLKSRDKIVEQEQIWRNICKELSWPIYASV